jgi:hypothetical protein
MVPWFLQHTIVPGAMLTFWGVKANSVMSTTVAPTGQVGPWAGAAREVLEPFANPKTTAVTAIAEPSASRSLTRVRLKGLAPPYERVHWTPRHQEQRNSERTSPDPPHAAD